MKLLSLAALVASTTVVTTSAFAAPPKVGDTVKDFSLESIDGETVTLDSVTDSGPAVIVVLRGYPGYQCPLCSRQVADFTSRAADFKKAGASLVFIYPGEVADLDAKAQEFLAGKTLPDGVSFLLDPGYNFTNAWDLRWNARNETAYPSTFFVDKNGKVLGAKVSKSHGGRTTADEILGKPGSGSGSKKR